MPRIGLMLYSVRGECERDFRGTLREVAAMGYEGVELFGLHGQRPEDVRGWLDDDGLVACGRHTQLEPIETGLPALAEEGDVLGWRRLVVSWIDPDRLNDRDLPGRLEAAAAAAASHGLELGYHNHDAEVRDGFLERVPPGIFLELDLGWAWWAGADPVELLEREGRRTPLVHVKDFRARGERSFCPVGDGAVGYERVAPAAVEAGVEWLLVEQDETDGAALEDARCSLGALRRMLGAA